MGTEFGDTNDHEYGVALIVLVAAQRTQGLKLVSGKIGFDGNEFASTPSGYLYPTKPPHVMTEYEDDSGEQFVSSKPKHNFIVAGYVLYKAGVVSLY